MNAFIYLLAYIINSQTTKATFISIVGTNIDILIYVNAKQFISILNSKMKKFRSF